MPTSHFALDQALSAFASSGSKAREWEMEQEQRLQEERARSED